MEQNITKQGDTRYLELTSEVVCAFLSRNPMPASELKKVIENVHTTLAEIGDRADGSLGLWLKPPVPIKKSVSHDYLICLEDGQKYKSLKRHLKSKYGMSPEDYRRKWGLPSDYPMIAPGYAEKRSELAKKMGLGRKK